jgi:hypothetical protein
MNFIRVSRRYFHPLGWKYRHAPGLLAHHDLGHCRHIDGAEREVISTVLEGYTLDASTVVLNKSLNVRARHRLSPAPLIHALNLRAREVRAELLVLPVFHLDYQLLVVGPAERHFEVTR